MPTVAARLLIVYNTCGIAKRKNIEAYIHSIHSILNQSLDGCRVVVSSCRNTPSDRARLEQEFGSRINYNYIDETLPVNVTFNHTVLESDARYGPFEGYMYVDSGIHFGNDPETLRRLYDLHISGPYGMTSARASNDSGTWLWFQLGSPSNESGETQLYAKGPFVIPVGKAVNLHVQIFDRKLVEAYSRPMPDIFASFCTESVFTFLCAALRLQWVSHNSVILEHAHSMDHPSSGFIPNGVIPWQHLFRSQRSMLDIIHDPDGIAAGFGYEECQNILIHDPSQYDAEGFCKNDQLAPFIKKNLFLPATSLDYKAIAHVYK